MKYLNSFYPLLSTKKGRASVEKYKLNPYIDGACRREPDFENEFPCITGLCRPNFVKKLTVGDQIVYVTNKKGIGSRKVVAVLKVQRIFDNHEAASKWYLAKRLIIPNNLIVTETYPNPLDKTHQKGRWGDSWGASANLLQWDDLYKKRALQSPKVAQCEIIYINLIEPYSLIEDKFNRPLCAQNPPKLSSDEWDIILESINNEQ